MPSVRHGHRQDEPCEDVTPWFGIARLRALTTLGAEFRYLASHSSERVRAAVALNRAVSTDLLQSLVSDASDWVAGLAASHPAASRDAWETALARRGQVLADVVAHPWLDRDLKLITRHGRHPVRAPADPRATH